MTNLHNAGDLKNDTHWTVISGRGPGLTGTFRQRRATLALCSVCGLIGEFSDSEDAYQAALASVKEHNMTYGNQGR